MNLAVKIPRVNWQIDVSKLYLWKRRDIVSFLFFCCILCMYLGSLHPWFFWPLKDYYKVISGALAFGALVIDNSANSRQLTRKGIAIPFIIFVLLTYILLLVNGYAPTSYIIDVFTITVMFTLLRAEYPLLRKCVDFICKFMSVLLSVSLLFFFFHLIGFGMPSRNAVFGDGQYSYTNYYFFMIDDRFLSSLIPRFSSVFLEPGHIGGASALLLMTQIGKWKRWYNIVLWVATLMTFSLAAYVFMVAIVFFGMWVQRKNIVGKFILVCTIIAAGVTAAFFYNGGDNMVHDLILLRLEVNEDTGNIEGNNRVSEEFEKEFDSYMASSDVLIGRDFSKANDSHGNSGYRVYIYENGLIATALVFLFYIFAFRFYRDVRFLLTSVTLALMVFWVRGYPMWYSNFVPLLVTAYQVWDKKIITQKTDKK